MLVSRRSGWYVLVLGPLVLGSSCSDSSQPGTLAVRDSSGITIWESSGPAWKQVDQWRIGPQVEFSLGSFVGDGPDSFGAIADVTTLDSGRVVVADALASEVRVFAIDGRHLMTIGGPGDGPGEFRGLRSVTAAGPDTLVVFDQGARRLSRFRVSGEFIESVELGRAELNGDPAPPAEVARLSDGSLIVREGWDFSGGSGVARDTAHFLTMEGDGSLMRVIDRVPGVWTIGEESNGRKMFRYQAFTPTPRWSVYRDTVYIAPGEWFEIRKVTTDGLVGIVRRSGVPRLIERSDQVRRIEAAVRGVPAERQDDARRFFESMGVPERLPAYGYLLIDPNGDIWAERFSSMGFRPGPEWDVFDESGQYLGTVQNPAGLKIFEIGRDHVLGVWADEFDVQYVRSYRLNKPEP